MALGFGLGSYASTEGLQGLTLDLLEIRVPLYAPRKRLCDQGGSKRGEWFVFEKSIVGVPQD